MKVSLDWLKDFVDIDLAPDDTAEVLTNLGLEVEALEYPDDFTDVVAGYIEKCDDITGSHNKLCEVNIGGGSKLSVVCGAPNCRTGILSPIILPGGKLPDGRIIEETVLAGHNSQGMLLSQAELNLGGEADGIWELGKEEGNACAWFPGMNLRDKYPPDAVFKLEITHNRPDCLCHLGVARDLAAGLNLELKKPRFALEESEVPASEVLEVEILDPDKCPRYCGRVMKGVEVKPSPRWMQRRLLALGLRPINNIVDVTNYILMETGHPLHAFDYNLVSGCKIVVKTAGAGERFVTLDEKEHTLSTADLLICDAERGVALAGVMGGLNSEITDETQDILLECAYFSPVGIRRTAKRHGIVSDSSYRFERGVDPNAVPEVIDRCAQLVLETAEGSLLAGRVDNYAKKIHPVEVELRPERVNRLLGIRLSADKMEDFLRRLGFETERGARSFSVNIPTFRPDISQEIDLTEEIARIHGYGKIPADNVSEVSLKVEPLVSEEFTTGVRQALVELGLREILTYSMRRNGRAGLKEVDAVPLRNPISSDFALLRTDLLAPLLETAGYNFNRGAESVAIFEIGSVFYPDKGESKSVAALIAGKAEDVHWSRPPAEFDFFHLKGLTESFLRKISLDNYRFSHYIKDGTVFEYAVKLAAAGVEMGILGKLKDEICRNYEVEYPVFALEFDFDSLIEHRQSTRLFKDFSRYPAVKRDLSLIFEETVSADAIEKAVAESGGKNLVSVEFFDLYRGKQLGAGKKSLSLSLRFQSMERTLKDEEVDSTIEKVVAALNKIGGELRAK